MKNYLSFFTFIYIVLLFAVNPQLYGQHIRQLPYESDSTFYRVDLAIKSASRCAYLYLEYDSIKYLPDNFGLLTKLRGITFKYCNQVDWDRSVSVMAQLPRLEYLEITVCKISKLTDKIGRLSGLRSLVLKTNNFLTIPESTSDLKKLTYVNLSFNPGMKWDEVFNHLPEQIQELDLSGNSLWEIPTSAYRFTALEQLHLNSNNLRVLPSEISSWSELSYLNLSNNTGINWKSTFDQMLQLKKLSIIKLSNNQLTELPAKIGLLTELTEIHADGNMLQGLPESIGSLTNLRLLNISTSKTGQTRNQIERFPASFGKLRNLEVLNMNGTYMISLPSGISKMNKLKKLYITWCGLTSLNEIRSCTQLEELHASHNYFDRIPDWIGELAALRILKLDGNYFPSKPIPHILNCPPGLGLLSNLEELSLNDQLIDKLPDEIGDLKKLKTLNVRNNKLESLPETMSRCSSLRTIDLKANLLITLPDFNSMTSLLELNISFNPTVNFDAEAIKFSKIPSLKKLDISFNNISANTLQVIRSQYPGAEVICLSFDDLNFNPDKKN